MAITQRNYLKENIVWLESPDPDYPYSARKDQDNYLIRINDFPAESLYTLIVNNEEAEDLDDWPEQWIRLDEKQYREIVEAEKIRNQVPDRYKSRILNWVYRLFIKREQTYYPVLAAVLIISTIPPYYASLKTKQFRSERYVAAVESKDEQVKQAMQDITYILSNYNRAVRNLAQPELNIRAKNSEPDLLRQPLSRIELDRLNMITAEMRLKYGAQIFTEPEPETIEVKLRYGKTEKWFEALQITVSNPIPDNESGSFLMVRVYSPGGTDTEVRVDSKNNKFTYMAKEKYSIQLVDSLSEIARFRIERSQL